MPTADALKKSITPGSVPYGERQGLEENLEQVAAANPQAAGPGTGGGGSAPAVPPTPGSPLGMLMGGDIAPSGQPVTSGLRNGPGPGPAPQETPWNDNVSQRLRYIAQYAKTPQLRAQARAALRFRVMNGEIQR